MKKLIIAVFLLLTITSFAQEDSTKSYTVYLAGGLSISNSANSTFGRSSYPSLELGVMKDNLTGGLVVGRSNLSGFDNDVVQNYWYELKTAVYFPIGKVNGYGIFGIGNYISTKQLFIEYGAGFSYSLTNNIDTFVQASSWDGTFYITPGLVYNFK
jgi:hypothetical protein